MTPDDVARADQIRARADAARRTDLRVRVDEMRWRGADRSEVAALLAAADDVPWLLDRLAAETERADKAEAAVERVRAICATLRECADDDPIQDGHTAMQRYAADRVVMELDKEATSG